MKINQRTTSLFAALVLLIILPAISFSPCLQSDFTNWDDNHYITDNPVIKNLSLENLKTIFSSQFVAIYCPLVMVSFSLEHYFFGLNPFVYHLDNLLLHIASGLLVFWFAYLLSRRKTTSFITAILFSLHPMKVESVAWISARKDTLSTVFFLLALIAYTLWCLRSHSKYYWLAFLTFIIGLFTKPSVVTLPLALLLLDYYLKRNSWRSNIVEKIPFFIFGFLFSLINAFAQSEEGGAFTLKDILMFHDNILIGIKGIAFYLLKTILPFGLYPFYPYPQSISLAQQEFFLPFLFVCFLMVFLIRVKTFRREILFGFGFFFATIFLVLKFIPVGDTIAADRYMYIPSIGLYFMIASLLAMALSETRTRFFLRSSVLIVIGMIVFLFSFLSFRQCRIWKNSKTLFSHVLTRYPDTFIAHLNLGLYYQTHNIPGKAFEHYRQSLRIKPDALDSLNNIGTLLMGEGKHKEAISYFHKALGFDPKDHIAHYNLGNIYGVLGNFDQAINHFKKSIDLDPSFRRGYKKLLECYQIKGDQTQVDALMKIMRKKSY